MKIRISSDQGHEVVLSGQVAGARQVVPRLIPAGDWLSSEGVLFIRYRDTRDSGNPVTETDLPSPRAPQPPPESSRLVSSSARNSPRTSARNDPLSIDIPSDYPRPSQASSDLKILSTLPAIRSLIVPLGVRQAVR